LGSGISDGGVKDKESLIDLTVVFKKNGTKFSSYMCNSVNFQNKRVINGSKQSLCNGLLFPNRLIFITSRLTQNKSVKCRNPLTKDNDRRYIIGRRDLNPIENLWNIVKTNVERRKPKNCKGL